MRVIDPIVPPRRGGASRRGRAATVYRIVQEGLTNAAQARTGQRGRRRGRRRARRGLRVDVSNRAAGRPSPGPAAARRREPG